MQSLTGEADSILSSPVRPFQRLSHHLFGVQWEQHFPFQLSDKEHVKVDVYENVRDFISENSAWLFCGEQVGGTGAEEPHVARQRYYERTGDCFAFMHGEKRVGVFIGTPTDWETYYFRFGALLPEYQGSARFSRLLTHLLSILKTHGVKKVEADISPSNLANIHTVTRLRFNITALSLSEEWGALVRFTRFLTPEAEGEYLKTFCIGASHQLRRSPRSD